MRDEVARGSRARRALGRAFRTFLNEPDLSAGAAAIVLRSAFLAVFAAQAVIALLVAVVLAAVAGRQIAPSAAVAVVSIAAALGQVLLGVAITAVGIGQVRTAVRTRPRALARRAALSSALLSAVLLSTPAWFAAFGWLTGQSFVVLAGLAGLALLGYAFGILQLGPLARAVTRPATEESSEDEAASDARGDETRVSEASGGDAPVDEASTPRPGG